MPAHWRWLPAPGGGLEGPAPGGVGVRSRGALEVVPLRRMIGGRPVDAGVVVDPDTRLLLDETPPSERWVEEAVARGRLWRAAKAAR